MYLGGTSVPEARSPTFQSQLSHLGGNCSDEIPVGGLRASLCQEAGLSDSILLYTENLTERAVSSR